MTEKIRYEVLPPTEENIIQVESLRYNAYGFPKPKAGFQKTYFAHELRKDQMLIFTCYYQEELVGACYVSNSFNSLYIDQLFVAQEYQEIGLHIGKNLLEYILHNKEIVEAFFQRPFSWSKLAHSSQKAKTIYEEIGYREVNTILNIMQKKI